MTSHAPYVRQIFQIGDMPVHAHTLEFVEIPIQAGGQSQQFQDSGRILLSNSSHKPLLRKETLKISLFNDGLYKTDDIVQRFNNLVGKPVDFISYIMLNPPNQVAGFCCSCNCCNCHLLWLHNFGRITEFTVSASSHDTFDATISFEYIGYWKPLNRILWKPIKEPKFNIFIQTRPSLHTVKGLVNGYPDCQSIFSKTCWGFQRVNFTNNRWMFDPDYFFYPYCYFPDGYPQLASWTYWENSLDINRNIWVNENLWSAPPLSIYEIKNYDGLEGIVTINNTYNSGFSIQESTTTVDLSIIADVYVANSRTIATNDKIVFGDVDGGSYVLRGENVLFYCMEAVDYNSPDFPGSLAIGQNLQEINTARADLAQIHIYRRL